MLLPNHRRKAVWMTAFWFFLVLLWGHPILADTQYVSDRLIISVRESPSDDSQIVGYLKSDTPVEIVEENERHYAIRTAEGLSGWVRKKFITPDRPKTLIIQELRETISVLEETIESRPQPVNAPESAASEQTIAQYEQELAAVEDQYKQALAQAENRHQAQLSEVETGHRQVLQRLKADLEKAKAALAEKQAALQQLKADYEKRLSQPASTADSDAALAEHKKRIQALQKEIKALKTGTGGIDASILDGSLKWFIAGGGMLLLGLLIGRSAKRKRSAYRF